MKTSKHSPVHHNFMPSTLPHRTQICAHSKTSWNMFLSIFSCSSEESNKSNASAIYRGLSSPVSVHIEYIISKNFGIGHREIKLLNMSNARHW